MLKFFQFGLVDYSKSMQRQGFYFMLLILNLFFGVDAPTEIYLIFFILDFYFQKDYHAFFLLFLCNAFITPAVSILALFKEFFLLSS